MHLFVCLWFQTLDETRNDLEGWSPVLRKHVDTLVMDLTKRDALQLVYRAEDHAQALSKHTQALNRCVTLRISHTTDHKYLIMRLNMFVVLSSLSEVRPAAVNATSATQTNTNIRENTQLAEDLALAANQSASSALNQVRQPIKASGYCYMRVSQSTS